MRRNRLKARKNHKKRIVLVLLFLIILPLTAVYVGLRITEKWVMPALHPDFNINGDILGINNGDRNGIGGSEKNTETSVQGGEFLPLSMYMIQVASISSIDNIENFIGELNERKLSHIIYKIDNSYKVYTLGLTERSLAEKKLPEIRAYYPDAYISEIRIPSKRIDYSKIEEVTAKEFINNFNVLIEVMNLQAQEWNGYHKGEGLNQYESLLSKHKTALSNLKQSISEKELPNSFPEKNIIEKMINYHESNIKHALELINEKENIYRLHSLFLDSYFRLIDIVK